ncbi:TRAP transporter small permease [Acuticoccus sp. M5D2P5]|uniref:TRAP transporter small permease subunit n=1 Tax=Acuticoccus kalidii TaxID=2910977 RepID=UPI001F3DECB5|nr:TRAP transporter small permease [Acuticoccus kalidii]MCF3933846.1 TRAP transporter small permease [Acuticoccus kalidii]
MLLKALNFLTGFMAEICGWLLLVVMALLVVDLVGRGAGTPVYGVQESAMFAMIAIVYLGLPYAERVRGHVRVEFIVEALPMRLRRFFEFLGYLVAFLTIAVVLYAQSQNMLKAMETRQAVAGPTPLLTWPVKAVMTFALTIYLIQIALHTVVAFRAFLARPEPAVDAER